MRLRLLLLCLLGGLYGRPVYAQSDTLLLNRLMPLTANLAGPDTVIDGWAVLLAAEQVDTTGNGARFGVRFDERPAVVLGRFLNPQALHALALPNNDSLLRLYVLTSAGQWRGVAQSTGAFDGLNRIRFTDLDAGGQREIILSSAPGMNGNVRWVFLTSDAATGRLSASRELVGHYEANASRQRLHFFQNGGTLGNHTQTLYLWQNHRLVPVRQSVLERNPATGRSTLHYYANPQFVTKTPLSSAAPRTNEGLVELFRKHIPEDDHGNLLFGRYVRYWANFFKW